MYNLPKHQTGKYIRKQNFHTQNVKKKLFNNNNIICFLNLFFFNFIKSIYYNVDDR